MLVESTKQSLDTGLRAVTAKAQQMGAYKLSSKLTLAAGKTMDIYRGTTKLGTATLGKTTKLKGVNYALTQASNAATLKLSVAEGKFLVKTGKLKLAGAADSDIFYGGPGNNTITGVDGRDVAVYRAADTWGQDTIAKTNGTMTLVLQGIKKSAVTTSLSGTTMTITRNSDAAQKITVNGWSADTHRIVYNATATEMKAFTTYVNAASPTDAQKQAAQNAVWQKAGLASA